MPKFVVYEVWTQARVIEAESFSDAYKVGDPESNKEHGMNLCNWHVVACDGSKEEDEPKG